MKTKAFPILFTASLGLLLVPLAGCHNDDSAISARRDADGKTTIHVDGDKVDQNFEQANKDLKVAGQQLQKGAEEVGGAIQRGADKVDEKVGPVAREVLSDASVTAKVKARLLADPDVAGLHIDVGTVDGRVTLNGKVSSADERAEAEKLAVHTDGVKSVVNLIQVAGQAGSGS
ncbi:MAG: hyperosmotically inducible periplasmic protein [Acidobacteriota bacterium]|jgi:hyperosmotically inducible protein|nr:hyperosmotically inducible periplasmic protein [Acidobacteriota bacterium]